MQTTLVILMVAVAAIHVGRVFYKGLKQKENCACGCSACGIVDTCSEPRDSRPGNSASDHSHPANRRS